MDLQLPSIGTAPVPLHHFPTAHQSFIFRAWEYISPEKIAGLLETSAENVYRAAEEMGLKDPCDSDIWLKKGYITVVRRLWHILPYKQLLALLEMDQQEFARCLREEDFLDIKLGSKPLCPKVTYRDLTPAEKERTAEIRQVMKTVSMEGAKPFEFRYDVEDMQLSGKTNFDLRMVYSFSGLYHHALEVDSCVYCPDEMLEAYRKTGVNAIWLQGILYQLAPFRFAPELSEGYEQRLLRLNEFVRRCANYGIQVFLYLNEPRSMPASFFEQFPALRGHDAGNDKICMCTSVEEVRRYITDGVEFVCRNVPGIGGFFTITRSENPSNCYSHSTPDSCMCPRCRERSVGDVISEYIGCIRTGADRIDPKIKVIAWSWRWDEWNLDIISKLPDNVIVQCQSELQVPFSRGGVEGRVRDYSMSVPGPGERALAEWRAAKARGLETAAKIQVNTTWECSTVPALPVYPLIEEHIGKLQREGVKHLMLSWTLGGMPSRNMMYAAKSFCEKRNPVALKESPGEKEAARCFSKAFGEFPFHVQTLYLGPQNSGAANLLYFQPTGYHATMTCYAYDDLEAWRSIYPEDVFESQLEKLCRGWKQGLATLETEPDSEMKIMAQAAYCQFSSSLAQVRFYRARAEGNLAAMLHCAEAEEQGARKLLELMNKSPLIGFEAANHYYYSKGCLAEKILNCRDIIKQIKEEQTCLNAQ